MSTTTQDAIEWLTDYCRRPHPGEDHLPYLRTLLAASALSQAGAAAVPETAKYFADKAIETFREYREGKHLKHRGHELIALHAEYVQGLMRFAATPSPAPAGIYKAPCGGPICSDKDHHPLCSHAAPTPAAAQAGADESASQADDAVQTLIEEGWIWDGDQWQRPPAEAVGAVPRQELDALLDHIYEHGTTAEGITQRALAMCQAYAAVGAQRAEVRGLTDAEVWGASKHAFSRTRWCHDLFAKNVIAKFCEVNGMTPPAATTTSAAAALAPQADAPPQAQGQQAHGEEA